LPSIIVRYSQAFVSGDNYIRLELMPEALANKNNPKSLYNIQDFNIQMLELYYIINFSLLNNFYRYVAWQMKDYRHRKN
jgi:hypothetical protein